MVCKVYCPHRHPGQSVSMTGEHRTATEPPPAFPADIVSRSSIVRHWFFFPFRWQHKALMNSTSYHYNFLRVKADLCSKNKPLLMLQQSTVLIIMLLLHQFLMVDNILSWRSGLVAKEENCLSCFVDNCLVPSTTLYMDDLQGCLLRVMVVEAIMDPCVYVALRYELFRIHWSWFPIKGHKNS